jgi:hypothetical protein
VVKAVGKSLDITIATGGGAQVTVSAVGQLANLDSSSRSCVQQVGGCQINAHFLGIIWKTENSEAAIRIEAVPLAIW